MFEFDNGYVITLSEAGAQTYDERVPGPLLGNGKIVVVPDVKQIGTVQSMIGGEFPIRNGKYASNLTPGFHFSRVNFFEMSTSPIAPQMELKQASLNMQSGIYSSIFQAIKTGTPGTQQVLPSVAASVDTDMYTLRPYPYCVMQTFRVTIPPEWQENACFFHEIHAKPTEISNPVYSNTLIHSDSVSSGPAIQVLSAVGSTADASVSFAARHSSKTIASASVYLFESTEECDFEVLGTNTFVNDPFKCYTKVKLVSKTTSNPRVLTFRFHILTAVMSESDFPNPVEETKRIVINLKNKASTSSAVAAKLRAEHVKAWSNMWNSNIHIDSKTGISALEASQIQRHVRAVRYSLYSIFACTREGVNVDINPMNLMVADADGSTMTDGDMWIVPMLLLLKTDIARSMIEYKHKTLAAAVQLAASYGLGGAKFPYHTDVMGYQSALYWDAVSPLYVFNTCVVAINTWNYYRITKDREWMFAKGYTILKHCADFIVSLVELGEDNTTFVFRRVTGLSGIQGDNNAFTVYTARIALRYTLEASYDLQYPPRESWLQVYQNTSVPFFQDALYDVIKLHAEFPANSSATTPKPPIAEVLLLLLPYYNTLLFGTDSRITSSMIFKNLDFYKKLIPPDYVNHPVNVLLEASMLAQLAQTDQIYADQFYDKVDQFLSSCTDGAWGNYLRFGKTSTEKEISNDLVLAGMYLLMIIQSLGGLKIAGGITETRFLYEDMRIKVNRAGILPRTWRQLRIEGIGSTKATSVVINKVLYPN